MSIFGKVNTRQSSKPFIIPPPIGGLNGREPLANMEGRDAYHMDNAFPDASRVVSRKGCEKQTNTPLGGIVQTLAVYQAANPAEQKLLAFSGDGIYDVTDPTPIPLQSGLTSVVVQTTMFSNAADFAQHLIMVNGSDVPLRFDGTTVSPLVMTGIDDPATLENVFTFKGRLYFSAKNKAGFYFLPVGQIQGALEYFDLGQVSSTGGYLQGIASYSDGGETPNDYIVFIMSTGECAVYAGNDPGNVASWGLVGRYFASTPIGRNCSFQYDGELFILTLEGALPFSQIRRNGDDGAQGVVGSQYTAITSKLGKFLSDFNGNNLVPGWQGLKYPKGNMLILNVPLAPTVSGGYVHYVMNTTTKAWCRFTGWNGTCFAVFRNELYFGRRDGHVMRGDVGRTDDGETIRLDIKQAYNYFNDGEVGTFKKHFQWVELLIGSNGTPPLSGKLSADFTEDTPQYLNVFAPPVGAEWDVDEWDTAEWGGGSSTQTAVITLNREAFAGSLWLRVPLLNIDFEWYASQYVIQSTKGLL